MRITGEISVREARIPDELDVLRRLFREYQRELDIPVCFNSSRRKSLDRRIPTFCCSWRRMTAQQWAVRLSELSRTSGAANLSDFTFVQRHAVKVRADVCSRLQRLWLLQRLRSDEARYLAGQN